MTACGAAVADAFRHAVPVPRPQPYRLAKPGLEQVQKGKAKPAAFQKSAAGCSLSKKLRFCAKLPMNRACGPVRRARRGVILNEKRGSTPFGGIRRVACTLLRKDAWLCHRQLFPRTLLVLLCLFRRSVWARAFIFSAAAFHAPHSLATRASPLCQRRVRIYQR